MRRKRTGIGRLRVQVFVEQQEIKVGDIAVLRSATLLKANRRCIPRWPAQNRRRRLY